MNEDDTGADSTRPSIDMFVVPAGTKAKVRKVGETRWRPYVTKKTASFDQYWVADNGGTWTFRQNGFELKVPTCFVLGREPDALPPRSGVSYGGVSDASGRRSSRRRYGWGR